MGDRATQTIDGATISYRYNAANQLTAAGGTTYSYDANGNLVGTSNAKNQTASATAPGGAAGDLAYTSDTQIQRVRFTHSRLGLGRQAEGLGATASTRDAKGPLLLPLPLRRARLGGGAHR